MSDVDALIMGARAAEDTYTVCTRADLLAEFGKLDQDLRTALKARIADPRIEGAGTADISARAQDLQEQIRASTVEFRLRALAPKRWQALVAAHPPRQTDAGGVHEDDHMNVNNETFFPVLIRASVVTPKLQDETWEALLDQDGERLSNAQYQAWANKCWNLNVKDVGVPFSYAASLTMRLSEDDSSSPDDSASA
jgi:hypothetical protein